MQDKMTQEEIIKYVDILIQEHKETYDKRLSPFLYDFFIRSNEKFEWTRQDFKRKYANFSNCVDEIIVEKLDKEYRYFYF